MDKKNLIRNQIICLGCKKKITLDDNFEHRIIENAIMAIGKMIQLGNPSEEFDKFFLRHAIPDGELYCEKCKNKIEKIEAEIRLKLNSVLDENHRINLMLDESYDKFTEYLMHTNNEARAFQFLFTYIEECYSLASEIAVEIHYIFNQFYSHTTINGDNFSYLYYFRNAVLKSMSLIEKLIIFYSTVFNVEFKEDSRKNKYNYLLKKLKKKEGFSETNFHFGISYLKEQGFVFEIDKSRKSLDHDLSYDAGFTMVEIIKKLGILAKLIELTYNGFDEMVELCISKSQFIEIPSNYEYFNYRNFTVSPIVDEDFQEIKKINQIFGARIDSFNCILLEKKIVGTENEKRLFDILNRLFEVSRTHGIVFNLIMRAFQNDENIEDIIIGDLFEINYNSLINNMVFRVYSINDKLARYIAERYDLHLEKEILYFENFSEVLSATKNEEIIFNHSEIFNKIKLLSSSEECGLLISNRHRLYHLRADQNNLSYIDKFEYNIWRLNCIQKYYSLVDGIIQILLSESGLEVLVAPKI